MMRAPRHLSVPPVENVPVILLEKREGHNPLAAAAFYRNGRWFGSVSGADITNDLFSATWDICWIYFPTLPEENDRLSKTKLATFRRRVPRIYSIERVDEFQNFLKGLETLKDNTIYGYTFNLRAMANYMKTDITLDIFKSEQGAADMIEAISAPISNGTRSRYLSAAKRYYQFALACSHA